MMRRNLTLPDRVLDKPTSKVMKTMPILCTLAVGVFLPLEAATLCKAHKGGIKIPPQKPIDHSAEELFKSLDTNHDGFLSLDEFKASPQALKSPNKAEELFKACDTSHDGKVSYIEFKAQYKK